MLNFDLISAEEAKQVLVEEVVEDEFNAQAEQRLKDKFNQPDFHNFLLVQGLLPPEVLQNAVDENFNNPTMVPLRS